MVVNGLVYAPRRALRIGFIGNGFFFHQLAFFIRVCS